MTVGDLIEALSKRPEDEPVVVRFETYAVRSELVVKQGETPMNGWVTTVTEIQVE